MTPDELEAQSVKYNVARIVRLSSGNFALFSHYHSGAINLIKVGTLEALADDIPTAEACAYTAPKVETKKAGGKLTSLNLADLGL